MLELCRQFTSAPSSPRSNQQPSSAKQLHALGCSLISSSGPSLPAAGLWILGFWPHPAQGLAQQGHPARLLWESLCFGPCTERASPAAAALCSHTELSFQRTRVPINENRYCFVWDFSIAGDEQSNTNISGETHCPICSANEFNWDLFDLIYTW